MRVARGLTQEGERVLLAVTLGMRESYEDRARARSDRPRARCAERAKAFYASVFGWQPEAFGSPEAQMTLWRLPGYVGGEGKWATGPSDVVAVMAPTGDAAAAAVPAQWNVNLHVDDADATVERAAGLGAQVIAPALDAPGFRSAVLADRQGAVFSIGQLTAGP